MPDLYATLPPAEVKKLKPLIQNATDLDRITPKELFLKIQNNGTKSRYFEPISNFFRHLFGNYNQTTMVDNHLIVGNNIDLTANPNAIALFYEMDPTKDWKNILAQPGEPNPAFTQAQIDQLLCLSLTGVSNANGTFTGSLVELNACLGNLTDTTFTANQLVGLTSLVSLGNGTVPSTLQAAVQYMVANNNDLAPMQVIDGYSNPNANFTTQYQLLKIGAMFHGNLTAPNLDVFLTLRQKERLLIANGYPEVRIVGGPVNHGVPIGNFQESSFLGFNNVTQVPSFNPHPGVVDTVTFGTTGVDNLVFDQEVSPYTGSGLVMYAGDAPDQMTVYIDNSPGTNTPMLCSLNGNNGFDTYVIINVGNFINSRVTWVDIYDSDHWGKVYVAVPFMDKFLFAGPIVDSVFRPGYNHDFFVKSINESDGSTTLKFFSKFSGSNIQILDYEPGQFNLLPNVDSYKLADMLYPFGAVSQTEIALFSPNSRNGAMHIYHLNGTLEAIVPIKLPKTTELLVPSSMQAGSDGNFYVAGIPKGSCYLVYSFVNTTSKTAISKVVDEVKLFDCAPLGIFPQVLLTPTDASNSEFALVYVKQETISEPQYGLYTYTPSQGVNRIANMTSEVMQGAYSYNSVYAGPTNQGFIISSLQRIFSEVPYNNDIFEFSKDGALLQNYTLQNITFAGINPLSDGYFLYYQNDTGCLEPNFSCLATQIFHDGQWGEPTILVSNQAIYYPTIKPRMPILQSFGNDFTFLNTLDYLVDSYIFDHDNNVVAGPFFIGPGDYIPTNIASWVGSGLLPSGDVLLIYEPNFGGTENRAVIIPTSYLSSQPEVSDAPIIFSESPILSDQITVGAETSYVQSPNVESETQQLFSTNETDATQSSKIVSATLASKMLLAVGEATTHGILRAGVQAMENALFSKGFSERCVGVFSQLAYYTGFFGLRLSTHLAQDSNQQNLATSLSAMYRAAIDTCQLMFLEGALKYTSALLNKAGDLLVSKQWSKLGSAFKQAGSLARFGAFAWNARNQTVAETAIAVMAGAFVETKAEKPANYVVNKLIK